MRNKLLVGLFHTPRNPLEIEVNKYIVDKCSIKKRYTKPKIIYIQSNIDLNQIMPIVISLVDIILEDSGVINF